MIYPTLTHRIAQGKRQYAILIDPDKTSLEQLQQTIKHAVKAQVDIIMVGGSLLLSDAMNDIIDTIKKSCNIPVMLFPGSPMQIAPQADAIMLLSMISGRNAELLIGQHVMAAPMLQRSNLEIIPTGYILIDGGRPTSVSYISNTTPIPSNKPDIAACTALAGEQLGLKMIYLDAGSGALQHITPEMVMLVRQHISLPLIVGGGIRSAETAKALCHAGADIIVTGNILEKDPYCMQEIADTIHHFNEIV